MFDVYPRTCSGRTDTTVKDVITDVVEVPIPSRSVFSEVLGLVERWKSNNYYETTIFTFLSSPLIF